MHKNIDRYPPWVWMDTDRVEWSCRQRRINASVPSPHHLDVLCGVWGVGSEEWGTWYTGTLVHWYTGKVVTWYRGD